MQTITLSLATSDDVPDLAALIAASSFRSDGGGALLPLSHAQIERLVEEQRFAVVRVGDRLAGCVSLVEYGGIAELRSLAVAREFRSHGIGTMLANWCLEEATRRGYRKLYALTNEDAIRAFEKWGFAQTARPPEKLSKDCQACPLFHANNCKEVAVVRVLGPASG